MHMCCGKVIKQQEPKQGQGRGGIGPAGEHLTAERLRLGPFATLGELTGALENGQGNGRGVDAVSRQPLTPAARRCRTVVAAVPACGAFAL